MKEYERGALWILVVILGFFSIVTYTSLGTLEETVEKAVDQIEKPEIQARLLPVIPSAFSDEFKKAIPKDNQTSPDKYLWLTLRLTNAGSSEARITEATLSLAAQVREVFGLTADGKNFKASWGGPKLVKGGRGKGSVTVEFPSVPPGDTGLLFIGLQPAGAKGPPYDEAARRWWSDNYPLYWKELKIAAAKGSFDEEETTAVSYGFAAGKDASGS